MNEDYQPPASPVFLSLWHGQIKAATPLLPHEGADDLIAEVAARHGLTLKDLKGPSQVRRIAHVRFEAMWTLHQVPAASWRPEKRRWRSTQLGKIFGRDHTTILHGIRRWEELSA